MERVLGLGGLFFRSADPERLTRWYADCLGVDAPPEVEGESEWQQQAGPTVFAAMPADSEHFGRPEQTWAVNFRVRDLDAMVAQLRGLGVEVRVDPETYSYGRFADLHDPDGNPVQLWQVSEVDDHS